MKCLHHDLSYIINPSISTDLDLHNLMMNLSLNYSFIDVLFTYLNGYNLSQ
jgi:hypothetical protein